MWRFVGLTRSALPGAGCMMAMTSRGMVGGGGDGRIRLLGGLWVLCFFWGGVIV